MKITFYIKQLAKMSLQHIYLPLVYRFSKKKQIHQRHVIFADAHHNEVPFSMKCMLEAVKNDPAFTYEEWYLDFQSCSMKQLVPWLNHFMKAYANAEYVFLCDNFLPVSSCKKRKETTVVQLWHSGGLLKTSGYDSEDAVPSYYRGNVFKNYDLLTVSAPCCVDIFTKAYRQDEGVVKATGISRSDIYFQKEYNDACKDAFYKLYPEAKGKKVVLWAPTFRGNAGDPKVCGEEIIDAVAKDYKDYFFIKKLHPHIELHQKEKVSCPIPPEQLFVVTDLLITDYSSVVFDYLIYGKPFLLFAPDFEEYSSQHGFYVPYDSYPATVAKDYNELKNGIQFELNERSKEDLKDCYSYHMGSCDGHSTERILNMIQS